MPNVSGKGDFDNCAACDEEEDDADFPSIKPSEDPFIEW